MAASRPVRILANPGRCARGEWSTPCSTTSTWHQPTARFSAAARRTTGAWTGVTAQQGDFLRVLGGDGAWMVFDPEDEHHVVGSRSDIHIFGHAAAQHWGE